MSQVYRMGIYLHDLNLYGAGQAMLLGGSNVEFHIHKLEHLLNKVRSWGETMHSPCDGTVGVAITHGQLSILNIAIDSCR